MSYNAIEYRKQDTGTCKITCKFSKYCTQDNNNQNNSYIGSSNDKLKKSSDCIRQIWFLKFQKYV